MTASLKSRFTWAIGLPAFVFLACILITFTATFKAHPQRMSIPLLVDLLLTAPLAYFLVIRKTAIPKITVLRVGMIGVFIAIPLLSKTDAPIAAFVKTWVSPLLEITLISWVGWKFYTANKHIKAHQTRQDFLIHCRTILHAVCGNDKLANVLASEIAVFYYLVKGKEKALDHQAHFTCYKENGTGLVLSTFLGLFVVETAGMDFLFLLWSKTAAWILTGLSFYTCLQLLAHIRALASRPILLTQDYLLLRNGLMGGDALIPLQSIAKIEGVSKSYPATGVGVQKLALIKGLENHNTAIYLKHPVGLTKAFGIKRTASVILVNIDQQAAFIKSINQYREGGL